MTTAHDNFDADGPLEEQSGADSAPEQSLSDSAYNERNAISTLMITLLKGVIFMDQGMKQWNSLLRYQNQVRQQAALLNLQLEMDTAEGYAFLRNVQASADGEGEALPRLMPRRQLNFSTSLLLALLRRQMVEFDTRNDSHRMILKQEDLTGLMLTFQPNNPDQAKLMEGTESAITKVCDMGFMTKLKPSHKDQPPTYEVRRILRAFIDTQWLNEFDARLAEYAAAMSRTED